MRKLLQTVCGLWALLVLAAKSRFRMRSSYWRWRDETAFGGDPAMRPSRRRRIAAILDYGRWLHRMRRWR